MVLDFLFISIGLFIFIFSFFIFFLNLLFLNYFLCVLVNLLTFLIFSSIYNSIPNFI